MARLLDSVRGYAGLPPRSREGMLALLAQYAGEERVREIGERLDPPRRGGFEIPRAVLMIVFASRAGSGYAGRLLAKTPYFANVGENFRINHLAAMRELHGLADNWQAAQWMIANRGTPWAFGLKGGFTQFVAAAQLGFFPQALGRTKFIILRRRDPLAQAVSLLKARKSGRFHSVQPEGRAVTLDDYDADAIARILKHIERNYRWFEQLLARLGKPAPTYYYEDLCAAPDRFVRAMLAKLDLPPVPDFEPSVDLTILRDEINAAWAERYRAERGDPACQPAPASL
ncbi:MAG: hypothetical protein H7X93_07085 [Sphingomonadaceae bacterium]|nr:hypothetical protein [Sphingomonadaceae bacterium]